MSEQIPTSGVPDPPEIPQLLVWARWVLHHIIGDPTMIARNWRAILVGAIVLAVIFWRLNAARYDDQIRNLSTANEALQATNDQLREELKGASHQLAALQSRRAALRAQLIRLYTESGELTRRQLPNDPKTGLPSAVDANKYLADEKDWEDMATKWLRDNLGDAAAERFLDVDRGNYYSFSSNLAVSEAMNQVVHLRQNLETLLETAAYDK